MNATDNQLNNQRVIPLQGARNFRDLGGYDAADGRRVKWGMIFRSGSLAGLCQSDWQALVTRGVRALCDFRTTREREREPFVWKDTPGLAYYARDYASSFGDLRRVMASDLPTGEAARAAMLSAYRELPFEQSEAYRRLFLHLAANEIPLIFNCSAGKDRAGTAAALVLSALGVRRETVIEDYVLTNEAVNLGSALNVANSKASMLSRRPPEVVSAILDADPRYIETALDSIHERHGSIEAYLSEVLKINDQDVLAIRSNLLE